MRSSIEEEAKLPTFSDLGSKDDEVLIPISRDAVNEDKIEREHIKVTQAQQEE